MTTLSTGIIVTVTMNLNCKLFVFIVGNITIFIKVLFLNIHYCLLQHIITCNSASLSYSEYYLTVRSMLRVRTLEHTVII